LRPILRHRPPKTESPRKVYVIGSAPYLILWSAHWYLFDAQDPRFFVQGLKIILCEPNHDLSFIYATQYKYISPMHLSTKTPPSAPIKNIVRPWLRLGGNHQSTFVNRQLTLVVGINHGIWHSGPPDIRPESWRLIFVLKWADTEGILVPFQEIRVPCGLKFCTGFEVMAQTLSTACIPLFRFNTHFLGVTFPRT
jgi:hypothetical protein